MEEEAVEISDHRVLEVGRRSPRAVGIVAEREAGKLVGTTSLQGCTRLPIHSSAARVGGSLPSLPPPTTRVPPSTSCTDRCAAHAGDGRRAGSPEPGALGYALASRQSAASNSSVRSW